MSFNILSMACSIMLYHNLTRQDGTQRTSHRANWQQRKERKKRKHKGKMAEQANEGKEKQEGCNYQLRRYYSLIRRCKVSRLPVVRRELLDFLATQKNLGTCGHVWARVRSAATEKERTHTLQSAIADAQIKTTGNDQRTRQDCLHKLQR